MFRRIELINGMSADDYDNMIQALQRNGETIDKDLTRYWKTGVMGFGNEAVTEAWVQMPSPNALKTAGSSVPGMSMIFWV